MNGRLSAAELDHLRLALQLQQAVQHPLHLFQGKSKPDAGVGEANRASQIAAGIYFDKGRAGVLLVLRAQPAVQGTAPFHLGAKAQGHRPRLVEGGRRHVHLGVGAYQSFKPAVVRAALAHVDPVISQEHLGIDESLAYRADAAGQLVENGSAGVPCHS